jgi:hypothetical protein
VTGEQPPRVATGLADLVADGSLPVRHQGMISTLRQVAAATGIIPSEAADGWAGQDDETLLAQGRSSAIAGQMLAMYAVPALDGLHERFATGGDFLDVGVGVAELAAAFCNALPLSRVVGLDVMPRALRLAEQTVAAHGLDDRLELRLLPVQELADVERFDLAWMPAPFLPPDVFHLGLGRVHAALRAGGWLVLAAGRFDGDALAVAVTRWRTLRSGGTALTFEDAQAALAGAGFAELMALPTPPGAPALYAGRKP